MLVFGVLIADTSSAQEAASTASFYNVAMAIKEGRPIGPILSRIRGAGVSGWACSGNGSRGVTCEKVVETRCPSYLAESGKRWITGQMQLLNSLGKQDAQLAGKLVWDDEASDNVSARYEMQDIVMTAVFLCDTPVKSGAGWWMMRTSVYPITGTLQVGAFSQPDCSEIALRIERAREKVRSARSSRQSAQNSGGLAAALAGRFATSLPPSALLAMSREAGTDMANTQMSLDGAIRRRDIALWRSNASGC